MHETIFVAGASGATASAGALTARAFLHEGRTYFYSALAILHSDWFHAADTPRDVQPSKENS